MLFNSFEFIFFYLPIVFGIFFLIGRGHHRMAALWLALASLFFYGWWNPRFVSLLLASIVFNYAAGYLIARADGARARMLLFSAVAANLLLLGVFKYANFFITSINSVGTHIGLVDLVLPLGISFFTFTQLAFLVDVHRGLAREYNFIHYLLFVTWFPHLIAGPVLHHKQMMPQFEQPQTYRPDSLAISVGVTMFSIGLFKKVILADHFALFANPVFDSAAEGDSPMMIAAWVGTVAYALQLYFDFSGYSDMAIGLSKMFNVRLPLNFNSPYKATSIIDFWRRWHITLSNFLREYLYIALGGNRRGVVRRYANLLATMLLGGLWHGAGWNFVLWGGLHGLYLVVNHAWRWFTGTDGHPRSALTRAISVAVTFLAVIVAWVPFRATSLDAAVSIWQGMLGLNGISVSPALLGVLDFLPWELQSAGALEGLGITLRDALSWLAAGLFVVWAMPNSQQLLADYAPAWGNVEGRPGVLAWRPGWRMGVVVGLLFTICVLSFTQASPFLYFQF